MKFRGFFLVCGAEHTIPNIFLGGITLLVINGGWSVLLQHIDILQSSILLTTINSPHWMLPGSRPSARDALPVCRRSPGEFWGQSRVRFVLGNGLDAMQSMAVSMRKWGSIIFNYETTKTTLKHSVSWQNISCEHEEQSWLAIGGVLLLGVLPNIAVARASHLSPILGARSYPPVQT